MKALINLKSKIIGKARDLSDSSIFHKISLIAFFAWVGLGSDPLSSSCYGPEEIFKTLGTHSNLAIFAAIMAVITIFIISTSYRQIINLFPHGGGGYIVASKLISPAAGMLSGSALLIDYILTITISISSGADAIFSFLPNSFIDYKLLFSFFILLCLTVVNLRGVKESVLSLTPVFVIFIITHIILIGYGMFSHISSAGEVVSKTFNELNQTVNSLGIFGTIFIILKAYSMGAGTYTGIEAVSNGIPNLREPKVKTAQKTMLLLSVSLAIAVFGLMICYYLFQVNVQPGKTLNAVLLENATINWNPMLAKTFLYITLISEAALLFVAAQTGFLDGPRVMANMANDNWLPRSFTHLSDRLVSQNGILIMSLASFILLFVSKGSVGWLVILYSINVFITFSLSQFGMVRHWFLVRHVEKKWLRKLLVNGVGLLLTLFILISVTIIKFEDGGWITLVITGCLGILSFFIKKHYNKIRKQIINVQKELKTIMPEIIGSLKQRMKKIQNDNRVEKTAILLVNGYTSLGLYSLLKTIHSFDYIYTRIVFVQIGALNTNSLKGYTQVERMQENINFDLQKYKYLAAQLGLESDAYCAIGTDVVEEIDKLIPEIIKKYPNSIFIGGQLVFKGNQRLIKMLHNYTIFAIQRKLYKYGIMSVIIPFSLDQKIEF